MTRSDDQDEVVRKVIEIFADGDRPPKVKDRRHEPSSGYRAVHVVVAAGGLPVEIQIRTQRQDQWAQIVESLGDKWGRGIRYGELPPDPDVMVHPRVEITRREFWKHVKRFSERIDQSEKIQVRTNMLASLDDAWTDPGVLTEEGDDERNAFRQDVQQIKSELEEAEARLGNELALIAAFAEELE